MIGAIGSTIEALDVEHAAIAGIHDDGNATGRGTARRMTIFM